MESLLWPATVLILGLIALLIFKKPITRLIDRTEKVSKEGIQARATQEQQLKEKQVSKVDEFLKVYDNQLLLETEKLIKANLDALQPRDSEEREKFLLRNFAGLVITQAFDRTYYLIYGSQIAALQYLSDNRLSPQTVKNILPFYEEVVKNYQDLYAHYPFDGWLGFLTTTSLVQRNGNDVGITVRGKEFLKFLIEQGYSTIKLG